MKPDWKYSMIQFTGARCPVEPASYNCTSLAEAIVGKSDWINLLPRPDGFVSRRPGKQMPAFQLTPTGDAADPPRLFSDQSKQYAMDTTGGGRRKSRRKRHKRSKKIKNKSSNKRRKKKRTRRYKKKKRNKRKTRR